MTPLFIFIYAVLILIGGIIGYVMAHSLVSLFVATPLALILFCCSYFIWKGHRVAYQVTIILLACLMAFFGYRFLLNYQLAPAGIMLLITASMLTYLLATKSEIGKILS